MAARIARVNVFAVLLGCALLIGAWNNTTCDRVASAQACVRPVASWWAHLHGRPAGSVDIPTSPTPKPSSGQPKP